MKLTKSTLKRIIREELAKVAEAEDVVEGAETVEEDETVEETTDPVARIAQLEEELKELKESLK